MLRMLARTGFVLALLLGIGGPLGLYGYGGIVLWLHIIFGLLFLVPVWLMPGGMARAGAAVATLGAALAAVGALWVPGLSPWWHIVLMIVAIGLVEMGSGRSHA